MRCDHSSRQVGLAQVSLLLLALSVGQAHAQESLSVHVPPGCGSKEAFIAALVALNHDKSGVENLALTVEIRSAESEFALELTDAQGRRQLTDSSCETLFRTAVVIAAAALPAPDSHAEPQEAAAPEPATAPTPGSEPSQPLTQRGAGPASQTQALGPHTARPARSVSIVADEALVDKSEQDAIAVGPEFLVGLGAVIGATPKLSVGVEAGVGLRLDRWLLSSLVRYLPERTTTADASVRMRTQVWGGRLGVGYDVIPALRIVLGFGAQRVAAVGVGIRHPEADSVWFFAPELEAQVTVARWADWSADVVLQGRIALNTPRFEMEPERSVVFAVPRVGASGFFRIKYTP